MIFNDLVKNLIKIAPESNAEKWDNSGLQIGDLKDRINGIVLSLDVSEEVIELALQKKYNLIITHHPFIFTPIKSINFENNKSKILKKLINNNINLYSMHTNLDIAVDGVNSALAKTIHINKYKLLKEEKDELKLGYGGIGKVEECRIEDYAILVKKYLKCPYIKMFCNENNKKVSNVAFCGGSGSSFILDAVRAKADVYITGDISYHDAQLAQGLGLSIIDAGHYYTEAPVLEELYKLILNMDNRLNMEIFEKNTVAELII